MVVPWIGPGQGHALGRDGSPGAARPAPALRAQRRGCGRAGGPLELRLAAGQLVRLCRAGSHRLLRPGTAGVGVPSARAAEGRWLPGAVPDGRQRPAGRAGPPVRRRGLGAVGGWGGQLVLWGRGSSCRTELASGERHPVRAGRHGRRPAAPAGLTRLLGGAGRSSVPGHGGATAGGSAGKPADVCRARPARARAAQRGRGLATGHSRRRTVRRRLRAVSVRGVLAAAVWTPRSPSSCRLSPGHRLRRSWPPGRATSRTLGDPPEVWHRGRSGSRTGSRGRRRRPWSPTRLR